MNNVDERILESIKMSWRIIDEKTDKLLELADVLEKYGVNVRLSNGRYLNPVGAIRTNVSTLWDALEDVLAELGSALTSQKKE